MEICYETTPVSDILPPIPSLPLPPKRQKRKKNTLDDEIPWPTVDAPVVRPPTPDFTSSDNYMISSMDMDQTLAPLTPEFDLQFDLPVPMDVEPKVDIPPIQLSPLPPVVYPSEPLSFEELMDIDMPPIKQTFIPNLASELDQLHTTLLDQETVKRFRLVVDTTLSKLSQVCCPQAKVDSSRLTHLPTTSQIEAWLSNQSPLITSDINNGQTLYTIPFVCYDNHEEFSTSFLDTYPTWSKMGDFERYHYLTHIDHLVKLEKGQKEPFIDMWCFQFVMVCLIRGGPGMRQLAQHTLVPILQCPLRWFDSRYIFSGGMIREAMMEDPSHLPEVAKVLKKLICNKFSAKKVSDWVAFFEQYECVQAFLPILNHVDHPRLLKMKNVLSALTPATFTQHKVTQGLFSHVESCQNDQVKIKWIGCPMATIVAKHKIQDPHMVASLDKVLKNTC